LPGLGDVIKGMVGVSIGYIMFFLAGLVVSFVMLMLAVIAKVVSGEGSVFQFALFLFNSTVMIYAVILFIPFALISLGAFLFMEIFGPTGIEVIESAWNTIWGTIDSIFALINLGGNYVPKDFVYQQIDLATLVTNYTSLVTAIRSFLLTLGDFGITP
jgi:hypothetical protein